MKPLIVLLTDFGLQDAYVGEMKGTLYAFQPDARIVDLTHGIGAQQVLQGAIVLENAYAYFPKGSIFVCVVDPGVGTRRKILCARSSRYYFLGPDNGLLSLALTRERAVKIRSVENPRFFRAQVAPTFHGRDIMAVVAAYLTRGNVFSKLGPALRHPKSLNIPAIRKTPGKIVGQILFFDHFGNALTNIRRAHLDRKLGPSVRVFAGRQDLGGLRKTYGAGVRRLCALWNSTDYLEIALPGGSAKEQARLKRGTRIEIRLPSKS
jgi:S-adenosylmethionine hydrolase